MENASTGSSVLRAVGYARVSTRRQADHEVSLDEQQQKIAAYCTLKDAIIIEQFIERGLTGRTDKRPEFQRLICYVCDPANAVDLVVVYSFSRFFRNASQYLHYKDMLKAAGVRLVSATQDIPEGPNGELMETILAAFDGHQNEVNAMQVRDVMMANAENGFWNGSKPPFGYRTRVAQVLNRKEKKVLEVDPGEAEIVRKVYRLCLGNEPGLPPLGMKAIAKHLNEAGIRRRGKPFYTSAVADILTSETYVGTAYYNRIDSRTRKIRPTAEWIPVSVPAIIDQETFDAIQRILQARRPDKTAPRVVNGPTLLTGIAECGNCGRGMMLRTGKSGRYRYLTCAKSALEGTGCGQSVRMDDIDERVLSAVEEKVFSPDRTAEILKGMIDRSEDGRKQTNMEIYRLRQVIKDAKARVKRLYDAIEAGVADLGDDEFRQRIQTAKLEAKEAEARIKMLTERATLSNIDIGPDQIRRFTSGIRERLRDADPAFRRTWLHLFVDKVIVKPDSIVIRGPKEPIMAIAKSGSAPGNQVPSFAREWRARKDSNL